MLPPPSTRTATQGPSHEAASNLWHRLTSLPIRTFSEADQLHLEQKALDLLVQGQRTALLTTMLGPGITAALFTPYVGVGWAWIPAIALYLLAAERVVLLRRMHARRQLDDGAPRCWAVQIMARIALAAIIIALWNHAAIATADAIPTLYALSLAIIVCAGGMTQYCIWPAAVWALVTPVLLGLALQLLWQGGVQLEAGYLVIAIFIVALWITLSVASARFAKAMLSDLLTRLHNEALIAELDQRRQQAETAAHAKSRFLAAASHDLRQPVHAMRLLGAALGEQLTGTAQAPLMQQISSGIAQFSALVDEIMDLARVDVSALQAQATPVALHPLLARAETVFRPNAQERGLALWVRTPQHEAPPAVLADAALLWRVLGNLLANAVRYTPKGAIMLAVRQAHTADGAPAWRLEVRDSGPGIAVEHHNTIFDEFYRAHEPDADGSDSGHGLGLAVAQRMARLMGTQVVLHPVSGQGRGTVFSITLPRAEPIVPAAIATATLSATSQAPLPAHLHLLVVDDDAASRLALHALLQGWGVQATLADGLAQVRAAIDAQPGNSPPPFHAVLTDYWLPAGARALSVLRLVHARWPGLPAAVVSGGASEEEIVAITRAGARFWRKPLNPHTLRAWLASLAGPDHEAHTP